MSPEVTDTFAKNQMLFAYGVVMISTIAGALYLFYMIWKSKKEHKAREGNSN